MSSRFMALNTATRYRPGDGVLVADGRAGVISAVAGDRIYDIEVGCEGFMVTQHECQLLPEPRAFASLPRKV